MFDKLTYRLAYYNDISATSDNKKLIKPKLIIKDDDSEEVKKVKTELISLLMLFRHHRTSVPPDEIYQAKCLEIMDNFCKANPQLGITFKECMLFAKNRYSITAEIPASLVDVYKSIPEENMKDFVDMSRKHQSVIAPDPIATKSTICEQFFEFLTKVTKRIINSEFLKVPTRGVPWISPRREFWEGGGDRHTAFGFNAFAKSCGLTSSGQFGLGLSKEFPTEWAYWIAGVSVKENVIFRHCADKPEEYNHSLVNYAHENRFKVTPYQLTKALKQMNFEDYIEINPKTKEYIPLTKDKREKLLADFKDVVKNIPTKDPSESDKQFLIKKTLSEIKQEGATKDEPKQEDSPTPK